MKAIFLVVALLLLSTSVFADRGVVLREDVCGIGNAIIYAGGWYVAAEHWSGVYLYEGDVVYGKLLTYGFSELMREDGRTGRFYIEDYEGSIGAAFEELCD